MINMSNKIGNPELEHLFVETGYISKRKRNKSTNWIETESRLQMKSLYNLENVRQPVKGDVVSGKFESETSDQYIFEVTGFKDDIRVDKKGNEEKYLSNIQKGDEIDVLITDVNNNIFYIKGSVATLYETRAHQNFKALEDGHVIMGHVKSLSPAGYEVILEHDKVTLPGFMPNTLAGTNRLLDPSSIVGTTFEVMIESYSEQEGTWIVSRKKYLQSIIPAELKKLNYTELYEGHVTGTKEYGVFVEFNGFLTGMIHKANIVDAWRDRINEIKEGQPIEFYVKEIFKNRVILTQIIRETLWDVIKPDQVLKGTVKDMKNFGMLVKLDDETSGLIHISELSKIKKTYNVGDDIEVKVLGVDRGNRKIFLGGVE